MPELTDADRAVIARARELAAISADAAKEHVGTTDLAAAYAIAFGEARYLLAELADRLERHGGS